jgi:hypothetical protein
VPEGASLPDASTLTDQLDDRALWSLTHDALTVLMNSFLISAGNNRVWVCWHSRTGTPRSAQTRASALLTRYTSARRPFWFAFHSTQYARAGLCVTALCRRLRSIELASGSSFSISVIAVFAASIAAAGSDRGGDTEVNEPEPRV